MPEDPKEAAKLRARLSRFMILHKNLNKQGFSAPLLKCVGYEDANYILREIHERIYGNHIRARALARKALRQGYFWSTMLKDATDMVKRCKVCQVHTNVPHCPPELLTSVVSPWPFQ